MVKILKIIVKMIFLCQSPPPFVLLTLLIGVVVVTGTDLSDKCEGVKESESEVEGNNEKIHGVSETLNNLFKNYDTRIRPDFYGPPVTVGITLFVNSLASVSEVEMEYKLDFYLRQHWKDERLKFNLTRPHSNRSIEMIGLSHQFSQQIWQPDTFFPNEKHSYIHSATMTNEFIRIFSNGNILKSTRLTLTASCPMELLYWPMDQQICFVEIESYAYTNSDILYTWMEGNDSVKIGANSLTLPNFRVVGYRYRTKEVKLSTGSYSILSCEFLLVRFLTFYFIQVYIPSALVVIISWFSLWMGRQAVAERIGLGVTSVLTQTTLLMSTSAAAPKISYIKALDIYLAICFLLVFAALLQSTAVGYFYKKFKQNGVVEKTDNINLYEIKRDEEHSRDNGMVMSHGGQPEECPDDSVVIHLDNGHQAEQERQMSESHQKYFQSSKKIASVDIYARIIFPTSFSIFNVIYWGFYLNVMRLDRDDSWVLKQ